MYKNVGNPEKNKPYSERNPVFRYWVFTCNNYGQSNIECLNRELTQVPDFLYFIAGYETSKEGTPHLQGYIQFSKGIRHKRLRELLDMREQCGGYCNIERAKGSAVENRGYCWKGEAEKYSWPIWATEPHDTADFFEAGSIQFNDNQGGRTDLTLIKDLLDNDDLKAVKAEYFPQWCRYHKSFDKYLKEKEQTFVRDYKRRRFKSMVYCNWSEKTCSGKSRFFFDKYNYDLDTITYANGFLIGYTGNPVVLFDDFDDKRMPRGLFLQLMDRYPITVNVKGTEMEWNPKTICITSNFDPRTWYGGHEAIVRRLDEIKNYD